ncbi:MAG: hypothetical protein KIT09_01215 [Bryobacteraceae bacterium]|nr:hypothetical protein [Bryobacteraceae bacterium]
MNAASRHALPLGGLALCALLLGLASPLSAQETPKPKCTERIQGRFWPEAANDDPRLAQTLAQTGELEICSAVRWRYRWQSLTVHIEDLQKKHDRRARAAGDKKATTD